MGHFPSRGLFWYVVNSFIALLCAFLSYFLHLSHLLLFSFPQHPTNSLEWAGIFTGEDTHLLVEPLSAPSQPPAPALVEGDEDEDVMFDAFATVSTAAPVAGNAAPEEAAAPAGSDAPEMI